MLISKTVDVLFSMRRVWGCLFLPVLRTGSISLTLLATSFTVVFTVHRPRMSRPHGSDHDVMIYGDTSPT